VDKPFLEIIQDYLAKLSCRGLHDIYLLNEGLMAAISLPDGLIRYFCEPGMWALRWPKQRVERSNLCLVTIETPKGSDPLKHACAYARENLIPIPRWPEPIPIGKAD
jgi:hypothetical protein